MGLGLPLMSILTVSQFRAVLAHEFAHYYGGDTSLGPWVYKTKMAMIRTFQTMGSLGEFARYAVLAIMHLIVSTILKWYFIVFLRAINIVSRRQEFRADELACLVAGPKPLIDGLRAIHAAGPAWGSYWASEVSPILSNGRIPPLGEGFARFLASPVVAPQVETNVQKELREGKASPYDTHPPLRERIAAAEQLPTSDLPRTLARRAACSDRRKLWNSVSCGRRIRICRPTTCAAWPGKQFVRKSPYQHGRARLRSAARRSRESPWRRCRTRFPNCAT